MSPSVSPESKLVLMLLVMELLYNIASGNLDFPVILKATLWCLNIAEHKFILSLLQLGFIKQILSRMGLICVYHIHT